MSTIEFKRGHPFDQGYVDPSHDLKPADAGILDQIHYSLEQNPLAQNLVDVIRRFTDGPTWKYTFASPYLWFLNDQYPKLEDSAQAIQLQAKPRREDAIAVVQLEIVTPRSTRRFPNPYFRSSVMGIFLPQSVLGPKDVMIRAEDGPGLTNKQFIISQPEQTVSYSSYTVSSELENDLWLSQVRTFMAQSTARTYASARHEDDLRRTRDALT